MPSTVDVPEALRPVFRAAEELVSAHFAKKREHPTEGTIDIDGERYVLVRAASLSERFFKVVREIYGAGREREADGFARNILFDLAHAVGRSDAETYADRVPGGDPIGRLSAGPVHFAFTGWAKVRIFEESSPSPDDDYFLIYDHPYSFESDAWQRSGDRSDFPVCIMSSGYSSGWCEASFGVPLVATEVLCRACGDEACRFLMAPPHRIEERVDRWTAERRASAARTSRSLVYQIPDLFARKRLEDRLRQAHDDLEARVAERTAALEREMESRKEVERQLRQSQKMEAIGRL
ncbi:MAG: XylR N-terminal domain-containing protein, partial [Myxococcales bacterium]|nr:XylR N-terminal domain-containing protein [Myxococcales bacterium]